MTTDPPEIKLSSDQPESDLGEDAFGFGPFAEQLARSIAKMAPNEGMVLGVYAPWGSGKSTLLNFVERHLESLEEEERPVVLRFNPWWFSGDEALARHFMGQLEALVDSKLKTLGKALKGKIGKLAETVSAVPGAKFVAVAGSNLKEISESVATSAKGGTKDVVALKKEIGEALRTQDRTILVIIDDVDRLTPEEVRQLLKMVKAVADFPRVVYLLAFDKAVVARALSSQPGVDGASYLEKIIQVPFELPVPDRDGLERMFADGLNGIIRDVPDEDFDQAYWTNVFFEGIRHFLRTPRDVVRLVNSLTVTLPAVVGEVNVVDFVAVESLRVFEPALYDYIRRNPEGFSGYRSAERKKKDEEGFDEAWTALATPERRKHVEALVARIFPDTGSTIYNAGSEARWRRAKRVCSTEAFPVYFRFAVPTGTISNAEMKAVVSLAVEKTLFVRQLRMYLARDGSSGEPTIETLLGRLEDYLEETVPSVALEPFAAALLEVGDDVAARDDGKARGMFDMPVRMQLGRLFWQALRRMPEPERFPFLEEQFTSSPSLSTVALQCGVLGQQQGKNGSHDRDPQELWLVSADQLATLEGAVVDRVRDLSRSGALLRHRGMGALLNDWIQWGPDPEAAKAWAEGVVGTEEGAAAFVAHYVGESMSQAAGDLNVRRQKTFDLEGVRGAVDVDGLALRLRNLEPSRFQAGERDALRLFLATYNAQTN